MILKKTALKNGSLLTFPMAATLLISGCGGSSGGGSSFNAPAVAPIVNASLPHGLQAGSTHSFHPHVVKSSPSVFSHSRPMTITPSNSGDDGTNAQTYIEAMFNEWFINGIDGQTYQGYLNSLITAIDDRMSSLNTQISGFSSTPSCLSGAVTSDVFNLGAIDPMLNFTAPYLQCGSLFTSGGGNVAGSGSGMNFGTDGKGNFSMWLELTQSGSGTFDRVGGFIAVANVLNYGSTSTATPESVDGLLLSYAPYSSGSGINRITVARFTASKTTNSFALFLGSNSPNTSGGSSVTQGTSSNNDSYMGSGMRLVSDGTHVYSDGLLYDNNSSDYYNYNICLNAADLSVDGTPTDCTALANDYVTTAWASLYPGITNPNPLATTPTLNYNEVTGCAATLPGAGSSESASTAASNACNTGAAIPGPSMLANQTTPSAGVLSALAALSLPTNLTALGSGN